MADERQAEPRVVAATGVSANANVSGDVASAERQEQAMIAAIEQAHKDGVTDPDEIRERMAAAREAVLNQTE